MKKTKHVNIQNDDFRKAIDAFYKINKYGFPGEQQRYFEVSDALSSVLLEAGFLNETIEIVKESLGPHWAQGDIVLALAKAGRIDEARKGIDDHHGSDILLELYTFSHDTFDLDAARIVVPKHHASSSYPYGYYEQSKFWLNIYSVSKEQKDLDDARKSAHIYCKNEKRVQVFHVDLWIEIAKQSKLDSDLQEAFQQCTKLDYVKTKCDDVMVLHTLEDLIELSIDLNNVICARSVTEFFREDKKYDLLEKCSAWLKIYKHTKEHSYLNNVYNLCKKTDDQDTLDEINYNIVETLVIMNNIDEARTVARNIVSPTWKSSAWIEIAKTSLLDMDLSYVQQAIENITSFSDRAEAWVELYKITNNSDYLEGARQNAKKEETTNNWVAFNCWKSIAELTSELTDFKEAYKVARKHQFEPEKLVSELIEILVRKKIWEEACKYAENIAELPISVSVWVMIASGSKKEEYLEKAREAARKIESNYKQAMCYIDIIQAKSLIRKKE